MDIVNQILVEQALYGINSEISGDEYLLESARSYMENKSPKYSFEEILTETLKFSNYSRYIPMINVVDKITTVKNGLKDFTVGDDSIKDSLRWWHNLSDKEKESSRGMMLQLLYEEIKIIADKMRLRDAKKSEIDNLKTRIDRVCNFEISMLTFIKECDTEFIHELEKTLNLNRPSDFADSAWIIKVSNLARPNTVKGAFEAYTKNSLKDNYASDLKLCLFELNAILSKAPESVQLYEINRFTYMIKPDSSIEFLNILNDSLDKLKSMIENKK